MRFPYCIWALLLLLAGMVTSAGAQETGYTVFLRGTPIGREDVIVTTGAGGTTIVSEGRLSSPLNLIVRRAEFTYRPDWTPESFTLDADVAGADLLIKTTFRDGMAISEVDQSGKTGTVTQAISAQPLVHANMVFGGYAALIRRLEQSAPGTELRVYVVPQGEIVIRVVSATSERMQIANEFLDVRRYTVMFVNPTGELRVDLTSSVTDGSLLRLHVPAQFLDVVRVDLASSTSRTEIYSNPGDEAVTIPAEGFNLGATITRPQGSAATRLPAVILLSGANIPDREGFALGAPVMGQLAGALAQAGFMAVRFDKRGYGQSGGRSESATLADHAIDARSVLRWLERRKDVDPKRIALVGHGDGAWVALLAARERKFAAVVTIGAPSSQGPDYVLAQQQQALDLLQITPEERERRVALQTQINSAVLTGRGWDSVSPAIRKEADTLMFHSMLTFDPAEALGDVRQPLLFVHGELDREIPVSSADALAGIAKEESDSKAIEVVIVRGVDHLMLRSTDRTISADVTSAVTGWLTKTFQAIR